jgi:hypothetical protein
MKRTIAILALVFSSQSSALAQSPAGNEYPVTKMTARSIAKLPPALAYSLLPDSASIKPGNAALFWIRASRLAAEIKPRLDADKAAWADKDWHDLPLDQLNRKKIHEVLDRYRVVLDLMAIASRRSECAWEMPAIPVPNIQDILLSEVQSLRVLANVLSLKVRLELAKHQYDQALQSLQTGFALSRDIGEGPTMIHALVGIAVGSLMVQRVQEFIEQPDAPCLFWALIKLPQPFIDLRKAMLGEFTNLARLFPFLGAAKAGLTEAEANKIIAEGARNLDPKMGSLTVAGLVAGAYPEAKKALLARGLDAKEVEGMPQVVVVSEFLAARFAQRRDEVLKWMFVPYWQGHGKVEEVTKRLGELKKERGIDSNLFGLLMPGILKTYEAWGRMDLQLAGLRCAEAIRLYAATHGGKAPSRLVEISELPLPLDPLTGKSMEGWYKREADGAGVLEVPPPAPFKTPLLGRRYEIRPGKE